MFFVLFSCKKGESLEKQITNTPEKEIQFRTDTLTPFYESISKQGVKIKLWINEVHTQNKFFLSKDYNFIIASKEIRIDNKFVTVKKEILVSNEYTYTDIFEESFLEKKVKDDNYLLFSLKESFKGTAITGRDVSFFILNLKSLDFYTLVYRGEPTLRCKDCIDGDFEENKSLDRKAHLKKILRDYASNSKHIYFPNGEEKDINFYKNYVQKWYKDNNVNNVLANGHAYRPDIVYSTYYKKNIIKFTGNYGSNFIENDHFKIVNFTNGNLLAYDKKKHLYFPVFVESCVQGCNKEISFLDENTIKIGYNFFDEESFTINIDEIKFVNKK